MTNRLATRRLLLGATGAALAMPFVARAQVLSPGGAADISNVLASVPQFSRFVELISRAGLIEDMRGTEPMTVFAPVNIAFDRIPANAMAEIMGNENTQQSFDRQRLRALIAHHVVAGAQTSSMFMNRVQDVATRNGGLVRIDGTVTPMTVGVKAPEGGARSNFGTGSGGFNLQPAAPIVRMDISASNGLIHAIDGVLLS